MLYIPPLCTLFIIFLPVLLLNVRYFRYWMVFCSICFCFVKCFLFFRCLFILFPLRFSFYLLIQKRSVHIARFSTTTTVAHFNSLVFRQNVMLIALLVSPSWPWAWIFVYSHLSRDTLPRGRSSPLLNITHTTAEFTRYLTGDMPRVLRLWRGQNWNHYEIEAIVKGKQTRKNLLGPSLVLRSVVLFCCYYC